MVLHQTFVIPSPRLLRERDLLFAFAPNCAASGRGVEGSAFLFAS